MRGQRWKAAALLVLCLLLVGCGQKGPLYREESEADEQAMTRQLPTHLIG